MISAVPQRVLPALALIAGLLVAPGRAAQDDLPPTSNDPPWWVSPAAGIEDAPWIDGDVGVADDLQAVALGDLDGDGVLDGVVRCGDRLAFMPALTETSVQLTLSVDGLPLGAISAYCLLPRPDAAPLLAIADAAGPRLLEHVQHGDFALHDGLAAGAHLAGARQLRADDQDGDGLADLWVLSASGTSIEVLLAHTWSAGPVFALDRVAEDMAPLDWDADGDLEVAVATADGALVHDWDPVAGASWPTYQRLSPYPVRSDVARLRVGDDGPDRLAWSAYVEALDLGLLSILQDGEDETHVLSPDEPAQLAAADLDADGDDDLVLTFADRFDVLTLTQSQPDPQRFDPQGDGLWTAVPPQPPGSSSGQTARPAVADMTGEGQPDVVLPCPTRRSLATLTGPLLTHVAHVSPLRTIVPNSSHLCVRHDEAGPVVGEGFLRVSFDTQYPLDGADAWRLGVWAQAHEMAYTTPAAECLSTLAFDAMGGDPHRLVFDLPPSAEMLATDPQSIEEWIAAWQQDERVFHLKAWPIDVDGTITPTSAGQRLGPSLLASLSFDVEALSSLPLHPHWNQGDHVFALHACTHMVGGFQAVGGFYFVQRQAPPPPDEPLTHGGLCLEDLHP